MFAPIEPAGLFANNVSKPVIEPTYLLSTSGEFQRMLRRQCPGTCNWIFDTPEYKSWHDESQPRKSLLIHGPIGTGKSVLAASIVNQIQETEQDAPLFHFSAPKSTRSPFHKAVHNSPWHHLLFSVG